MTARRVLRVGLDGTPLLGARTGIGQYTAALVRELATRPELSVRAIPFTARRGARPADLPASIRWRHVPVPARGLQQAWARLPGPQVQLLSGPVDVFHATNFVLPPTGRAAGVVTVHDLSYLRYPELVSAATLRYRELVPRGLARAAAVLTPTRAIADELVDAYALDPELVTVTPLGIDPSWGQATAATAEDRQRWDLPDRYLLAVGTIEPRKGLDVLVAAYRELLRERPDAPPLVLVGAAGWGGPLDLADLPPDRIRLPGYIPYRDLQRVVAGASVFVFPSRYEGFGLPPLEAMAAGVPVLASDIPTSVEVLDSYAGFAPMGDAAALAAELGRALSDPPSPAVLDAARQYALGWTWQRCADLTEAAYRRSAG